MTVKQSYPQFLAAEEMNSPNKAEKIWKSIENFFSNKDLCSGELRISFCTFLRISQYGLYPLMESNRRPMVFGPFGGVYKFRDSARTDFDSWFFNPEETQEPNDLSGFIPTTNLRKVIDWFCSEKDRESMTECISRELNEELEEIGFPELKEKTINLKFRPVRTAWLGPKQVPDEPYHVFRIFDVMTLADDDQDVKNFVNLLFERITERSVDETTRQPVILATHKEIDNCQSRKGHRIGTHCQFLFHGTAIGPEPPPIPEMTPKTIKIKTQEKNFHVPKSTFPNRVSTGCASLDRCILGGIPEKYACALSSAPGDGRELLIKRFREVGLRKGEITFCITQEDDNAKALAEEYQSNFFLFLCNPRADVTTKNLPNIFKLKGVENLTEIDIALTKALRMIDQSRVGQKRACIEIISDVLLQHKALITRKWLLGILTDFRSKGFTTLAIVNPKMHPQEELQAILCLFDGEIEIAEKETEKGVEKTLRIKRLNNQQYLENQIVLSEEDYKRE